MFGLQDRNVLVVGLGASGLAAARLLAHRRARVTAVDSADTPALRDQTAALIREGVKVQLGAVQLPSTGAPESTFDLAVVSPGVPPANLIMQQARANGIHIIGELELGYQQALALNVAITGTNGKTTTTELVEKVLLANGRHTVAAGNIGLPLCAVAEKSRDLDFLTLEVSSFQLETIEYFRPAVGVLMNITPDHLDRYDSMDDYARAKARLFENQQPFDWAIVQSEAMAYLRRLDVKIRSKIVTFSAADDRADIYLSRGRIISRVERWSGPLLDMADTQLRGPHNAENIMAVLAVGHVLRLPLQAVVEAIKGYTPAAHRCELVGEVKGVQYVNDSKATNVDAVAKALETMPKAPGGRAANVWLLAGGRDKGFDFGEIGGLLSERVKGAILFGETREKIRAAWSPFTPCTPVSTLLEALDEAAKHAEPGDVVLLSPACSSFDQFRNYQHRGEVFRQGVHDLIERTRCTPRSGSGRESRSELLMI